MQQRNKGPRCKTTATSRKPEGIQQDGQTNSRTGSHEASSRVFHRAARTEWLDTVEGSTSSETKEEMSKAQTSEKKDDGGTPGPTGNISGNHSGRPALRREQREQLESNHRENRATGKEGETDHRRHKHSPRKRRNGCTPVGYSGRRAVRSRQRGM
jgi:hypothetical protein